VPMNITVTSQWRQLQCGPQGAARGRLCRGGFGGGKDLVRIVFKIRMRGESGKRPPSMIWIEFAQHSGGFFVGQINVHALDMGL
jgi:hypothetical protein